MSPKNEEQNRQIRDERREQILNTALEVFARKGLSSAKISDIAALAGLSHGLIYHYFKSKDEIFTELVKRAIETSMMSVQYMDQIPGTPFDKLHSLTEMLLSSFFRNKTSSSYFLIMLQAATFEAVPQAVKEILSQDSPSVMELTAPLIAEGQRIGQIAEGDPLKLASAYWALMQGLVLTYSEMGDPFPVPESDIIMRLFKVAEITS